MGHDERDTKLQQGRCGDCAGDDVIRYRGNTHPEHQAHGHGEQQREQEAFCSDFENEFGKVRRCARQCQHADDDADDGAGHAHGKRLPSAIDQAAAHDREGFAPALSREVPQHERCDHQDDGPDAIGEKASGAEAEDDP